jgi:hypothetical protein
VALLYEKRREVGAILLGVTALTGFIDWSPTRYLPQTRTWENLRMPTWLDEIYFWMSIGTLVGFIWILYRFGFLPARPAFAAEGSAASRARDPGDLHGGDDDGGDDKPAASAPKPSARSRSKSKSSSRRRK